MCYESQLFDTLKIYDNGQIFAGFRHWQKQLSGYHFYRFLIPLEDWKFLLRALKK